MKNFKLLSFCLLFGILVLAGCEKTDTQENLSCEGEDICPVETNIENPSIEIEETPSVIYNDAEGDLNGNGEGFIEQEIVLDTNEQTDEESTEQPMMRKIIVDENVTAEEIENEMTKTCETFGGSWGNGTCTLSDGSVIAF